MKFIANENFPLFSVAKLREAGHTVISISERSPGVSDSDVLRLAAAESGVLLTFDGDYGELIYLNNLAPPQAVLFLRFKPVSAEEPARVVLDFCQQHAGRLVGNFCVLERSLARVRPLPPVVKL